MGPLFTATHASDTLTSSWKLSPRLEKLQRIKQTNKKTKKNKKIRRSSLNLNMKINNAYYYCVLMLQQIV